MPTQSALAARALGPWWGDGPTAPASRVLQSSEPQVGWAGRCASASSVFTRRTPKGASLFHHFQLRTLGALRDQEESPEGEQCSTVGAGWIRARHEPGVGGLEVVALLAGERVEQRSQPGAFHPLLAQI